jgi:hypothetical protein
MAGYTEVMSTLKSGARVPLQIQASWNQNKVGSLGLVTARRTPLCGSVHYSPDKSPVVRINMDIPGEHAHLPTSLHLSVQIPDDRGSYKLPASMCAADMRKDDIEAIVVTYYTLEGVDPEGMIGNEPLNLSFEGGQCWSVSYAVPSGSELRFIFKEDDDDDSEHDFMRIIVMGPPLAAQAGSRAKRDPSADLVGGSSCQRPHTRSCRGVGGSV